MFSQRRPASQLKRAVVAFEQREEVAAVFLDVVEAAVDRFEVVERDRSGRPA